MLQTQSKTSTNVRIHFTKCLCLNIRNDQHNYVDWFAQDSPSIIDGIPFQSQKYLGFDDKFYGHPTNEKLLTSSRVLDSQTALIIASFEF